MKKVFFILIFPFLVSSLGFSQKTVTINNLKPRVDVDGISIDVDDGRVIKFGGKFYWYGTAYGNTSGFIRDTYYQCYSSEDLKTWKKEKQLLENPPSDFYYRPHVIYNKQTKKYVLWYNWYPVLWIGKVGVAISDKPEGPFKIVNSDVRVLNSEDGVGDLGLFIDDDETAYLLYNTIDGHKASIEKLSKDYQKSTLENSGVIARGCEAGAIFKRGGKYYFLTDNTCCFCSEGTGARVYISEYPLTGYQLKNNINRYPGIPATALIDGFVKYHLYSTIKRQPDNSFSPIQIDFYDTEQLNRIQIYQFPGNRQGVYCGDTLSLKRYQDIGIPAFDLFIKEKGEWVKMHIQLSIEATSLYNIITLQFDSKITKNILIKITENYPYDEIFINEIRLFDHLKQFTPLQNGISAYINDNNHRPLLPIIPAQQTYVMPLETTKGIEYIWMGDMWGSAPDNIKGHDQQYWSEPLVFDEDGNIETLRWVDEWQTIIPD